MSRVSPVAGQADGAQRALAAGRGNKSKCQNKSFHSRPVSRVGRAGAGQVLHARSLRAGRGLGEACLGQPRPAKGVAESGERRMARMAPRDGRWSA